LDQLNKFLILSFLLGELPLYMLKLFLCHGFSLFIFMS